MYCSQCGAKVTPNTKYCSNCGAPIEDRSQYNTFNSYDNGMTYRQESNNGMQTPNDEKAGLGFGIVALVCSFVFPIVGLIFGIISMKRKDDNKAGRIMGIIGFVISLIQIIFTILIFVIVFIIIAASPDFIDDGTDTKTFASPIKCAAAVSCQDNYDDTMTCVYYNTNEYPEEILCEYDESKLDEFKNVEDDDYDYDLNDDDLGTEEEI